MSIIKSSQAADQLTGAIVLDLGDLRRQADQMLARAEAEAKRIVAEGARRAAELARQAEAQARQRGLTEGKQAGYEAGLKQGREEAMKQTAESLQQLQKAWIGAAMQWEADRRTMLLDARQSMLDLALAMARKIVRRVTAADRSIVVDQVHEAISQLARPCDVTIRIHPDDRPLLQDAMPKLLETFSRLEHVKLAEDASLTPGGCIVEAGAGRIDATIERQLDRLVGGLLGETWPQPRGTNDNGAANHDFDHAHVPDPEPQETSNAR